ncbi:synaptonemal complex central element protein 1 isoform X3 [Oryctolagus cuniculus]|uniref:synaptonemal complex central element protein 1 isoform X3 n=2 Tax=Oryctolagus cuniculus TaxID=9986 RepID=UPI00387A00DE
MAARSGPSRVEPMGAADRAEKAAGQDKSQKIDDLMDVVARLQKVGSLEPRVEVLINRINEVQQAKKKASEELGEARTVWEALQKELDVLHGEKARVQEILNKKQETLRILRLHCQEKESEAQRKHTLLQEYKERIFVLTSQIEDEKNKQRQLRLNFEEQLEELMGQHKDLWESHRPERLARELCTLDSSKEQLLKEGETGRRVAFARPHLLTHVSCHRGAGRGEAAGREAAAVLPVWRRGARHCPRGTLSPQPGGRNSRAAVPGREQQGRGAPGGQCPASPAAAAEVPAAAAEAAEAEGGAGKAWRSSPCRDPERAGAGGCSRRGGHSQTWRSP